MSGYLHAKFQKNLMSGYPEMLKNVKNTQLNGYYGQNNFLLKIQLHHFFRNHIRLPPCQISEKCNERIPRKVGNRWTNERTNAWTNETSVPWNSEPAPFGFNKWNFVAPFVFRWKFGEEKFLEKFFLEKKFCGHIGHIGHIGGHIGHFGQIGQIWHQNRIFSGKMTILSYRTIFLPTFSAILENLLESFFRKVPKTVILGQNGHFSAR